MRLPRHVKPEAPEQAAFWQQRLCLPGLPRRPPPNPSTCWPDPGPVVGIASRPRFQVPAARFVVELFRTIPTGCGMLWKAGGLPGDTQLVFVRPRSWYSVPSERCVNERRDEIPGWGRLHAPRLAERPPDCRQMSGLGTAVGPVHSTQAALPAHRAARRALTARLAPRCPCWPIDCCLQPWASGGASILSLSLCIYICIYLLLFSPNG